ncbi:transposase [Agrobacterium tumefaciens]|uniref:Transposase n=1 Tax=Agrobacterium tumefaciens TaxID=358 RepID=A0AAW8M2K8_AGRTU|nr:transposase [Agrobacterium tumefaciens]MDR6705311.1 transposase [Agrobacterium tumefaciens]
MKHCTEVFIGINVSKARNAIAVADGECGGEVRYLGEVDASVENMRRFVKRLAANYHRLHFCCEAGPAGYGLPRLITELGCDCIVVAPPLIPKKPGDRVKTNRRDAISLAKLLRADELTGVWVPDAGHEAMRDLVRARTAAFESLRVHRQQVSAFMLNMGGSILKRQAGQRAICAGFKSRGLIILRIRQRCRR